MRYSLKEAMSMSEQAMDEMANEMAVTPQQATQENLALYFGRDVAILYDWQDALRRIQASQKALDRANAGAPARWKRSAANSNVHHVDLTPAIRGYLYFGPSGDDRDSCEIMSSAAVQGYGPLMYDLVMTHIYPKYLMSDRMSVSKSAFGVWQFYLTKRPDVEKKLIGYVKKELDPNIPVARKKGYIDLPASKGAEQVGSAMDRLGSLKQNLEDVMDELKFEKKSGWNKYGYFRSKEQWERSLMQLGKKAEVLNQKISAQEKIVMPMVMQNPLAFKYRTRRKASTIKGLLQNSENKFFMMTTPGGGGSNNGSSSWTPAMKREALVAAAQDFFSKKYRG